MHRILALLAVLVLLCACGQRGPLYFRDSPPPGVKPEKPAAVKPTPYPAESDEPTLPGKGAS
jgi:predicted small lipoprotein YifL